MSSVYALYALRYGIVEAWTSALTHLPVRGYAPPAGDHRLFCYSWLAVSPDRTVLIDGGCDEATARSRGVLFERSTVDSLRVLGIAPESVDDIVVTHLHWDHAGNLPAFPGARVHVHPAELGYAVGPPMEHRFLRRPYAAQHLQELVAAIHEGRVKFTSDEVEVAPGITVHAVGGHTPGTQVVRVPTARGPVVVASDARHYEHNAAGGETTDVPFSMVADVADYCAASLMVDRLAGARERVIPGHDPAVAHHYPVVEDDELIVRLDTDPRLPTD